MERLTERSIGCFGYDLINAKHSEQEFGNYDAFYNYSMAVKKLGEYEDAEEQGLLLRLPCPIGSTIYKFEYPSYVDADGNEWTTLDKERATVAPLKFALCHLNRIGDLYYLTKAEAEQALAKMKGV